jgi:hypothetical protein
MAENQATSPDRENVVRSSRTSKQVALNRGSIQKAKFLTNPSQPTMVDFESGLNINRSASCAMMRSSSARSLVRSQPIESRIACSTTALSRDGGTGCRAADEEAAWGFFTVGSAGGRNAAMTPASIQKMSSWPSRLLVKNRDLPSGDSMGV